MTPAQVRLLRQLRTAVSASGFDLAPRWGFSTAPLRCSHFGGRLLSRFPGPSRLAARGRLKGARDASAAKKRSIIGTLDAGLWSSDWAGFACPRTDGMDAGWPLACQCKIGFADSSCPVRCRPTRSPAELSHDGRPVGVRRPVRLANPEESRVRRQPSKLASGHCDSWTYRVAGRGAVRQAEICQDKRGQRPCTFEIPDLGLLVGGGGIF